LDKGPDQAVGGHYPILINKPLYDVIDNQERFATKLGTSLEIICWTSRFFMCPFAIYF
jgi:hypothetical protein